MRTLISFSGGKDSMAALLWIMDNFTRKFTVVFCDTGWESPETYKYILEIVQKLNLEYVELKSKKYDGMIDLAKKKKRFPSVKARFCTTELKTIPMVDYILDVVKDDFIAIQGIRASESESRSKMQEQCNYFKFYTEPYGIDKKGKPKFHTYRRKDILKMMETHATDVWRPVFDWDVIKVVDFILDNGFELNPLYKMGMKRVGCFPCVMSGLSEIHQLSIRFPERIAEIAKFELEIGSTFFGPDKIPRRYYKGKAPLITDIIKYANGKYEAGLLFDEHEATSCMSYYGLCE